MSTTTLTARKQKKLLIRKMLEEKWHKKYPLERDRIAGRKVPTRNMKRS